MKALIGYNGFVGSNLRKRIKFQKLFNSENIDQIKMYKFTEVYCAAPHSLKFWANKNPKKDKEIISRLIKNLKGVKSKNKYKRGFAIRICLLLTPQIKKHTRENTWNISRNYIWNIQGMNKEYL